MVHGGTAEWTVLLAGAATLAADKEKFEAGPTGLLVIALLAVGILILARSMLRHLRKVPESFDPPSPEKPAESTETESTGTEDAGTQDADAGADSRPEQKQT